MKNTKDMIKLSSLKSLWQYKGIYLTLRVMLLFIFLSFFNNVHARRLWTYTSAPTHAWNGEFTWTDITGGGDIIGGPYVPQNNDTLYIVGANTRLYLVDNIALTNLTIFIENGSLDLANYTFTESIKLYGPGTLKLKSTNLPSISNTHLFEAGAYGGTVEYYDFSSSISSAQATYYNLTLSGSGGETITVNRNIEVLGNLNITRTGVDPFTAKIGSDATARTIIVRGDITINSNASLNVGNADALHSIEIYGNLYNDGGLNLTNDVQYAVSITGAATLTFKGETYTVFSGSGTQKVYRMIIDKGTGQTFTLDCNPENLSLYYPTSGAADNKALRLINGTLILGDNISIPKLTDEETASSSSNFVIPANGHLRISGASVSITDGDGVATNTGVTVQGKLTVTDGTLSTEKSDGITLSGGQLFVQGGTVSAAQISSTGSSTLNISGGTITLNEASLSGNPNTGLATLSLPATSNNFTMSGGTLNIYPTATGAVAIGASTNSASGGTVNIYTSETNALASTSAFYNLTINEAGTLSLATVSGVDAQTLVVNNNLTINTGSTLLTNDINVKIGRNFTNSGGTYTYGTNTTEFFRYSGNTTSSATVSGITTLNNVSLNKSDAVSNYNNAKTTIFSAAMDIKGSLSFDANYQTLDLNGNQITVQRNVTVNRISRVLNDSGILLKPSAPVKQTLTIGKLSSTNSFVLDNSAGARISESASMGTLTLTSGSLYIGNKTLTLSNPVAGSGFGEDKMVSTNGTSGELKYVYSGSGAGTYLYPVGTGAAPPEGEDEFSEAEDFSRNVFSTSPQWTSTLINGPTHWVVDAGSALFNGQANTQSARMETPVMDLSSYSTIYLNFREQRPKVSGSIDELAIYYNNGSGWTLITTYTDQQDAFTDRTITLPNLSSTYRVGFRAIASNKNGSFTRIDDVEFTNLLAVKKYTPFTMTLAGTGSFSANQNTIGVIPVNSYHPGATDPNNEILMPLYYYWKVNTSLPDGSPANLTVEYQFSNTYNVLSGGGNWAWRLVSNVWTKSTDYTEPNTTFTNIGFTQGEFTAGKNNAFVAGGGLTVYYSRNAVATWNWDVAATWSTDPDLTHGGAQDGGIPALGDYVIIAPGHNVVVTNNTKGADYILINSGGILDVGTTNSHTFDIIRGQGTFRIASASIPLSKLADNNNFTDFLTTDFSTFEFYGGAYPIPSTFSTFYNLIISGAGAKPLPTIDLTVRNNLTVNASTVSISNGADGDLAISNNLTIENGGTLTIPATANVRTISASNVLVNNATFNVENAAGTTHTLSINGGSLNATGTGTISLYQAGNNVDATLSGSNNVTIGSGGRPVSLNRLTVAKDNLFDEVSVTAQLQLATPSSSTSMDLNSGTLILESTAGTPMDIVLSDAVDFSIPETAALIVRGTNNAVSTTTSGDIVLEGLLRFDATGQADIDGDVRYSSTTGNAALEINGSSVVDIGGQLKQSGSGSINFTQTGGTATVGSTSASDNTHGVFEVVGGSFTYNGGTLTISRGSGYTQGDILLDPSNFDVAAGATLNIQAASAGQTITINSSSPLSNLNIASNNSPTVTPIVRRLTLEGNFTNAATFNCSGKSLSVKGNFSNSGTFTATATDTVIFSGATQTLTNTLTVNFHHMVSEPSVSLTFNQGVTINGNLTINSGTFADGGNTITVKGNLFNYGIHTGAGKIYLNGTTRQDICGCGGFTNLDLDNNQGVRLVNPVNVYGNLYFTNGILNIQSYLLNLGVNTSVIAVGDGFSHTKMIQSNGTVADEALQKNFSSSFDDTFTFPVGTYMKYRPFTMDFDGTSNGGSVKIYPVSTAHPTITPPIGDPTRVLQYYWGIVSNISGFTGEFIFKFENEDLGINADKALFYNAQLVAANDSWLKSEFSSDNKTNNTITFTFSNAESEDIDGSFTAGEADAIPDVVQTYSSVKTGDWDDPTVWDRNAVPPQGAIVVIQATDTVSITTHRKRPYKLRINGRLWIMPGTLGHNFGLVQGTGTLALEDGTIPPGKWRQDAGGIPGFIPTTAACGTGFGTVEFGGAGYDLDVNYTRYYNLTIKGTGIKTLPSADITICGNLRIEGSATLKQPGIASGQRTTTINGDIFLLNTARWEMGDRTTIRIKGNFEKENTARLNTSFATQVFEINGINTQTLSGTFNGLNQFSRLKFDNPGIVTLNGTIDVILLLYLTNGRIQTTNANILRSIRTANNNGLFEVVNGFTEGPISVNLNKTSPNLFLPVGKNNIRKFIYPNSEDLSTTIGTWIGEYFNTNPTNHDPSMSIGEMVPPIESVSQTEYWRITGPTGVASRIRLTLNGTSDIAAGVSNLNLLRIVYWNSTLSKWEIAGTSATVTGNANIGTISTTQTFTFNGAAQYFTLAAEELVTVVTAQFTGGNQTICYGEEAPLQVTFSGDTNYNIQYSNGTDTFSENNISENPYSFNVNPTPTATKTYTLTSLSNTGGDYPIILGSPVTITVVDQPTQYNIGGGGAICGISTTSITLDGSQLGFTYYLYRDGATFVMERPGTGSALTFSPISIAGVYHIEAFKTGYPQCPREMIGTTTVTIVPTSTLSVDSIAPLTVCDGEMVTIYFKIIAAAEFDFTLNEGGSARTFTIDETDPDLILVGGTTYSYTFTAVWLDQSGPTPGLATFVYTVSNFTDTSGCDTQVSGSATLDVWKIPETGPQYHIPNTFGE
jgi:hypothetical protein